MCIIANPVVNVASTKLYVSPNKAGTRQLTIYSNDVDTMSENAMILPVPTTDVESIQFIDLSHYKTFFDTCQSCFQSTKPPTRGDTQSYSRSVPASFLERSILKIHDVGSYKASIVPSLDDFDRLDTSVFQVKGDLAQMLKTTYSSGFSFIVCKLEKGSKTYHPFAYSHPLAQNGKLFIPTKHWHMHTLSVSRNHMFYAKKSIVNADWDHIIYSPNTELDSCIKDEYKFVSTIAINWELFPTDYRWASSATLNRWTKMGDWKNIDIELSC